MQSHHYHGGQINGLQNAEQNSPLASIQTVLILSVLFSSKSKLFQCPNKYECTSFSDGSSVGAGGAPCISAITNINLHKVHNSIDFKLHQNIINLF